MTRMIYDGEKWYKVEESKYEEEMDKILKKVREQAKKLVKGEKTK